MPCCVRFLFPLREPSFQFPVALTLTSKDNHGVDVVVSMVTTNLSLLFHVGKTKSQIETKNLDLVYMDLLIAVFFISLTVLFIYFISVYLFCLSSSQLVKPRNLPCFLFSDWCVYVLAELNLQDSRRFSVL